MENNFFTFIKPYLSFIDNGHLFRTPFRWLYTFLGIVNLLLPVYVISRAAEIRIFDSSADFIIVFLLLWIIIAFAAWVSFQLWWDRRTKIEMLSSVGDEFIATPVFSHFVQTLGEWIGTYIGIVGLGFALLTTIILGEEGNYLGRDLGMPYLKGGWTAVISMPVTGFLIIAFSRFLSEQVRALSTIAKNTSNQTKT
jgi:hypothetical protein